MNIHKTNLNLMFDMQFICKKKKSVDNQTGSEPFCFRFNY